MSGNRYTSDRIKSTSLKLSETRQRAQVNAERLITLSNPYGLNARELMVLEMSAHGATDFAISETLGIEWSTVTLQQSKINHKLGVTDLPTSEINHRVRSACIWHTEQGKNWSLKP